MADGQLIGVSGDVSSHIEAEGLKTLKGAVFIRRITHGSCSSLSNCIYRHYQFPGWDLNSNWIGREIAIVTRSYFHIHQILSPNHTSTHFINLKVP